jgi:hypothetical protein
VSDAGACVSGTRQLSFTSCRVLCSTMDHRPVSVRDRAGLAELERLYAQPPPAARLRNWGGDRRSLLAAAFRRSHDIVPSDRVIKRSHQASEQDEDSCNSHVEIEYDLPAFPDHHVIPMGQVFDDGADQESLQHDSNVDQEVRWVADLGTCVSFRVCVVMRLYSCVRWLGTAMTDSIDGASAAESDVDWSSGAGDSRSSTSAADSEASDASAMRSFEELFRGQQSTDRRLPGMLTHGSLPSLL